MAILSLSANWLTSWNDCKENNSLENRTLQLIKKTLFYQKEQTVKILSVSQNLACVLKLKDELLLCMIVY